jgi:hypothetical protein
VPVIAFIGLFLKQLLKAANFAVIPVPPGNQAK